MVGGGVHDVSRCGEEGCGGGEQEAKEGKAQAGESHACKEQSCQKTSTRRFMGGASGGIGAAFDAGAADAGC